MADQPDLESLYQEARTALKAREYDRASDLFRQILLVDENFKDASRLLVQSVKLHRRRWYNHPLLWGGLGLAVLVGLGFWLAPRLASLAIQPVPTPSLTLTTIVTTAPTIIPSLVPSPTPTPIPLTWKRLWMGQELPRDNVTAIVFDPEDPDVVYVGTQNAGIYKTIDRGQSWMPTQHGLGRASVISLLIDPQDPQVLYAVTGSGGFQTVDGGQNWRSFNPSQPTWHGYKATQTNIQTIAMDPRDSSLLYATDGSSLFGKIGEHPWVRISSDDLGCFQQLLMQPVRGDILLARCNGYLARSESFGGNWEPIYLPEQINEIVIWQAGAQGEGIINVRSGTNKTYLSLDDGKSWEVLPNYSGPSRLAAALPDGVISLQTWADGGYGDGFYKVTDNWKTYLRLGDPDLENINTVAVSPYDPDLIFAGGEGLAISTDGGRSWNTQENGLGAISLDLLLSPAERSSMYLQAISWSEMDSARSLTLFHSTDGGYIWEQFAQGLSAINWFAIDADGSTLYSTVPGLEGLYGPNSNGRSTDLFSSWVNFDCQDQILAVSPRPGKAGELYLFGRNGKVWLSTDHANTCREFSDPTAVRDFGLNPVDFNNPSLPYLYVSWDQKVYLSLNDRAFSLADGIQKLCGVIDLISVSASALAIDPQDENHLFLATMGGGIQESTNGCTSWESRNNGLGNLNVNTLSIDPNNPGIVYAGTDGGAYISYDGGTTWGQVNSGLLGATVVYSIVVDKDSNVYAATPYGIFSLESR
jgi:photosystem II stability/assembly factor-like uncharacterized protein